MAERQVRSANYSSLSLVPLESIPTVTEEVSSSDGTTALKICRGMEFVCRQENGAGISAVQVGLPLKLFIVNFDGRYQYFANCDYLPLLDAKEIDYVEGCLSLPNRRFKVKRYSAVSVRGCRVLRGGHLEKFDEVFHGYYAIVMQHEIDHQNNVMIHNIGKELA